jgi:predicted component of type VI protein secretion system
MPASDLKGQTSIPPEGLPQTPFEEAPSEGPARAATGDVADGQNSPTVIEEQVAFAEEPTLPEADAMGSLFVERGVGAGQQVPILQGGLLIGRASGASLRLQHTSVSRRHAFLVCRGDRFFIRDLSSQNGTYVNHRRIDGEVEVSPGDVIVVGTAQLRLHGKQATAGTATEHVGPRRRTTHGWSPPGTFRVAAAAGAMGFGVAAVAMVLYFKLARGPSYEALAPEPLRAEQTLASAPADTVPSPQRKRAALPPPQIAGTSRPAAARSTKAEMPVPLVNEPVPSKEQARTSSLRNDKQREAEVLAQYEAGDVQAAIAMAQRFGLNRQVKSLTQFQKAYDAGERALAAQQEAVALRNLIDALRLDEQLSKGWGKYNARLRRQLSNVETLAGLRLFGSQPAAAHQAFLAALEYDPDNATAKAHLRRLTAGKWSARSSPRSGPSPHRQGIDAAFDE